jgi:hypothetical protein
MYLDDLAAKIREHIPDERMPDGDANELLRIYAVLLRAKGADVTRSDIHDAWSAWMAKRDGEHASLVPYENLPEDVREEDRVFATAVRRAADQFGQKGASRPLFAEVLFPSGPPEGEADIRQALDLYKIMVASSEGLVTRRQGVNTFFLTMNGALLTASGIIVQSAGDYRLGGLGVAVLAVAGVILCAAWRSLITSFGQLNRGKFQVINTIERYLKAAIYAAEWEALGRGEDPKVYRSFTSREIWVPTALLVLYGLTAVVAVLFASGVIPIGGVAASG